MSRILAIVVTFNARLWIDKCLGSLLDSSERPDITVIDNASSDGTSDYIREFYADDVDFVELKENVGFGQANNVGLKKMLDGNYDFAYLLNQDAWVNKDTLEKLVNSWRADFGIMSPVQINADGKMDRNFSRKCKKYLSHSLDMVKGDRLVTEVPFVMAAHWLLSREAVKRVGGFSPAFAQYGEDDNYIDRLHYHGLRVGVAPDVTAVHDRGGRKDSRERRLKLKCVSVVVSFSNPRNSLLAGFFLGPLKLLGMTVKNFSFVPVKFIPVLIKRYPELVRMRRCSKREGAFLL